ncbi:MAG: PQQ-dependent dehydrogenase, methanol/ethanol family [Steroidobacteraceae bacterium]|nr:PQQ-dependent dehydrogenase, methanol/ethanol family [Steroidobacteraceae bacterium]
MRRFCVSVALAALVSACSTGPESPQGQRAAANVTTERLLNAANEPSQWLTYNGDYNEQRYSRLKQINTENVATLGLAWYADFPTNLPVEGSPLYIDGVIYQPLPWSKVAAYDARKGTQLWLFDPKVPGEWNINICCGIDTRGLAAWNGKIIVGTLDGRLIAVDAATGQEVWSVNTIDKEWPYSITGAPRVAKGKVFIGNAGADLGVRGYVSAYDAETGKFLWRFYTVPGDPSKGFENEAMERAAKTWTGEWWKLGGGGTVWDAIVYDPKTDLLYIGVGNGSPWNQKYRSPQGGDNLYLSSIVALKPDTGEYVWHYQETPGETWDYTATQHIMIADLEIDGRMRHVVMQAPKNGFFYVLDAATGELISANPFAKQTWAKGVDLRTGRPIEVPEARYNLTGKPFNMLPGPAGAHAWQPMAYSHETGYVYIPSTDMWSVMSDAEGYTPTRGRPNSGTGGPQVAQRYYAENPDAPRGFVSRLIAFDPVAGKQVWSTPDFPPGTGGIQLTGGALATAGGLVFHGNLPNREFVAYRATDGEPLWRYDIKTGVFNAAITYELDGEQYVALAVGGPGRGGYYAPNGARLLVFKLGGTVVLPDIPPYEQPDFVQAKQFASAEVVARGSDLFANNCAICHGQGGAARATFPDLRRSQLIVNQAAFDNVVLQGALSSRGMGSFADRLQPADTEALRAYLIAQAETARNAPSPSTAPPSRAIHVEASDARAGGDSSPRNRR